MRTAQSYVWQVRCDSYDRVALKPMPNRRQLTRFALAGGAAVAGGVFAQRRHTKSVAADPERALLEDPPRGEPLDVTSADGTQLHAEAFGLADGPTLVLAHGWTETLQYWIYEIRELSNDFRIVAYDARGHGRSGRPPSDEYGARRQGEDLEAVLQAAVPSGERAIVAGHSLGGMAIAAWADQHEVTARVSGAALLFTGVDGLIGGQLVVQVPRFAQALSEPIAAHGFLGSRAPLPRISTPIGHAAIRRVAFGPAATPAKVAFYEGMLIACPPDVRSATGLAMQHIDLRHALPNLTVPTLVMAGELDRLTPPAHARRIAAELPNLQALIELPDTGHMGPLERPAEVSAALRELAKATQPEAAATLS
jgi:pimeloyl-ACP methyl ester carboxylesterase